VRKYRGLCDIWEIFKGFSGVLEGLEPICNYFSKKEGLTGRFQGFEGLQVNL
jgi:hypothetical protein